MTWVKIDDQFHAHPKVLAAWEASPAALGLHARSLSHAAAYRTDGAVSEAWVKAIVPRAAERRRMTTALVQAGLWEESEGGWVIHDYLDFNPSRADIAGQLAERSEAGRRGARKRWQNGSSPNGELMPPTRPVPDLFPQLAG